jgi:non-specific protein-tyrosine kinase
MDGRPRYTELRDYLRVARQQRVVIIVFGLLFAGAAFALSARETPQYVTSTDLAVRDVTQSFSLLGENPPAAQPPERLAALVAQKVKSREVANAAALRLGNEYTPTQLSRKVQARVETSTNFVDVQATDDDPRFAARIANAFARATVDQRREEELARIQRTLRSLEQEVRISRRQVADEVAGADVRLGIALQRLSQLRTVQASIEPVTIADVADVPSGSVSPRPVRDTILGLVLGLTIGLLVAFTRDALDRRLRTPEEAAQELDLPVIGRVGSAALGTAGPGKAANGRKLKPGDAEAFRILRTNVDILARDQPLKLVVVTSGLPEEGKSTVAASLAAAAAIAGRRVLLVEADLRKPAVSSRFGVERAPGLTDLLAGRATRHEAIRKIRIGPEQSVNGKGPEEHGDDAHDGRPVLEFLPAGAPHPQPAELLGEQATKDLLVAFRDQYDLVVIDTSPALAVADTLLLVPIADAVVLCVRAMRTTRDQARATAAALKRLPERPTALVVTGVKARHDETYGHYYSYAAKSS